MQKKQFLKQKAFRFRRFERKRYSAYNSMHKVVTIGVLSIMTLANSLHKTANAQTIDTDSITMYGNLQEVSIQDELDAPINQVGKVVTIITRQEIEHLKVQSVAELLTLTAGIDVQTRGTHSIQADISLRGGNFDQTAILLNGINITNPHTGHYSLDIPINISDIERIEIIKGPSAIIYGASAFSGGVNIITKKDLSSPLIAKIEAGEHGFGNIEISNAYKIRNMENYLSLGLKNSKGYIPNSDYDLYNIMYQSRINLKNNNKIDIQIGYNKKNYGANTFYSAKYPNQYEKTSSILASMKGLWNVCDNFTIIPSAYYNMHTDEFELIRNISTPNYHKSNVLGNNWAFSYKYKSFKLNFGSDIRYEEILSSVLGKESALHGKHYNHYINRINFSYFLQGNYTYNKWNFVLGVMSFQNTSFNQSILKAYPSLNINYMIFSSWEIFFAFNTSSRLPSFTELYYKDAVHIPNPLLKQEKSTSWEIGIKHLQHIAITSLNAYYMIGSDMIDWVKHSPWDEKWQTMNINELRKCGFDIESKIYLKEIFPLLKRNTILQLSYSFINQKQGDIDYISQYVLNYLKHKFTTKLFLPLMEDLTLTLDTRYCLREGSYIEYTNTIAGEEKSFAPYFIVDCNLNYTYKFAKHNKKQLDFYINCTNITNNEYFDIGNIPQPKRWFIGGVKLRL